MKKTFKILLDNSNSILIFITIISLFYMINVSLQANRKASINMINAVNLYTEYIQSDSFNLSTKDTLDSFSGFYFGESGKEVTALLEELKTGKDSKNLDSKLLQLIKLYENIIAERLEFFNTLFYFLIIGTVIQFIFIIVSARRYIASQTQLKNSEEVLKLLNSEREKERLRISSMLHDSVLQDIGSLLLTDEMIKSQKSADELRQISADLREMTYQIAPLQIKTSGFQDAAEDLIRNFRNKNSCKVTVSFSGYKEEMLDNDAKLVFYRILQEALTNIQKHSLAENIELSIVASYPFLIMRIKDDGIGIIKSERIEDSTERKHIGMLLMNEQAKSIGAVLAGESEPDKGTKITLKYRLKTE